MSTKPENPAAFPNGTELIAQERARQRSAEGYTASHDDKHMAGEIAMAAVCYTLLPTIREAAPFGHQTTYFSRFWPWEPEWWKPSRTDRVRELVKAGALIAAEIDRLQRAAGLPAAQRGATGEGK